MNIRAATGIAITAAAVLTAGASVTAHAGTPVTPKAAPPATAPASGATAAASGVTPKTTPPTTVQLPPGPGAYISGITEQCDHSTFYCLNDQNNGGLGSHVNMYSGGFANDAFTWTATVAACGDGHVHNYPNGQACPFKIGTGENAQMDGAAIFEERYKNGECVGTVNGGNADMVTCPDSQGLNGGPGSLFAAATSANCAASNNYYAEDVYWSGAYGSLSSLHSTGFGNEANIAGNNSQGTCWGQYVS